MNWDTEIWVPCRLGEAFTLREFRSEHTEYLYSIKADWMGHRGDGASVRSPHQLEGEYVHPIRVGIGPRPWANCWTYEPKIKITPPVWCWDMQDDTMFGLELKPKRNGSRRKAKLDCVMIHKGRPVYCIVVETSENESRRYYDSIPVLDPYFAPIWPATAEETPEVAEPAPEPVADPVADQTTDSENSADVAILPSLANYPERDTAADLATAATYAVGGIIHTPGLELEADPGELIVPADQLARVLTASAADMVDDLRHFARPPEFPDLQCRNDPGRQPAISPGLRRILTTCNAADLVAIYEAKVNEDTPDSWTGTENRPPGACIGGRTPFSGKYYYYVWFEEPPTEGETYEQKAGP